MAYDAQQSKEPHDFYGLHESILFCAVRPIEEYSRLKWLCTFMVFLLLPMERFLPRARLERAPATILPLLREKSLSRTRLERAPATNKIKYLEDKIPKYFFISRNGTRLAKDLPTHRRVTIRFGRLGSISQQCAHSPRHDVLRHTPMQTSLTGTSQNRETASSSLSYCKL